MVRRDRSPQGGVFVSLIFIFLFCTMTGGGNGVRYNEMSVDVFVAVFFFIFLYFTMTKGGLLCVVKRDLSPQEVYLSLFFLSSFSLLSRDGQ